MQRNDKTGSIEPEYKDILEYYLAHAKDEANYLSNEILAEILGHVFQPEDLQDIINKLNE